MKLTPFKGWRVVNRQRDGRTQDYARRYLQHLTRGATLPRVRGLSANAAAIVRRELRKATRKGVAS